LAILTGLLFAPVVLCIPTFLFLKLIETCLAFDDVALEP
jgi:hypothetical protein